MDISWTAKGIGTNFDDFTYPCRLCLSATLILPHIPTILSLLPGRNTDELTSVFAVHEKPLDTSVCCPIDNFSKTPNPGEE